MGWEGKGDVIIFWVIDFIFRRQNDLHQSRITN